MPVADKGAIVGRPSQENADRKVRWPRVPRKAGRAERSGSDRADPDNAHTVANATLIECLRARQAARCLGESSCGRCVRRCARESRIDGLAIGQLTLTAASASHAIRGMCELKFAANVFTAWSTKIGYDLAGVVRDEARRG